ncbi:hypothetical protein [Streptomyces sp. NBC_00063]|uniref:hypothetical protein n=1 Tax=Streptomyces sp. NBC_00063 TaxID=2975638 RepID=UPI00225735F2|nr:hypothetical protein [Streptomyces sp. NBC_00063]MCX5441036.1 hypothetical protein [Streptomyces sp. NBC_00063]
MVIRCPSRCSWEADLTVGSMGEGGGPDHGVNGSLTYLPANGTKITTTGARGISATA